MNHVKQAHSHYPHKPNLKLLYLISQHFFHLIELID